MIKPNTIPISKRSRPDTTLFLSLSVDGRITSHDSDSFDPDKSWKSQPVIRGILQQFYEFNQPNLVALTTGVALSNLGVNTRQGKPQREDLSLVVLDPDADLTPQGLEYLSHNVKKLILVCLSSHPFLSGSAQKHHIFTIHYPISIDLNDLFTRLYKDYQIHKLFIHSIAPLNADLLDAGLIDHLTVNLSPLMVGGHGTPALQDSDIFRVRPLKLVSVQSYLENYVNLRYDVIT